MFTTLDKNKVSPGHMWGRIYMKGSCSDLWKSLWAAGTAPRLLACSSHSCADRSGAALHTVTARLLMPCPSPLVPSMSFYFFDSYLVLTELHSSIPMDWGLLFLLCTAQPNIHTEAASQASPQGISWRGFWGWSKTQPHRAKGFPHTVLSETSAPAQCHCHLIRQTQRCQESAALPQNSNLSPPHSEPLTFPIISTDLQGVNLGYGL